MPLFTLDFVLTSELASLIFPLLDRLLAPRLLFPTFILPSLSLRIELFILYYFFLFCRLGTIWSTIIHPYLTQYQSKTKSKT